MAKEFLQTRRRSFSHAFSGLAYVFRTQKNTWIHALATVLATAAGFWLQISRTEWAVLAMTIAAVWTAECFNTAIEAVVDLASPQLHPLAKIAKDSAAAGVLVTAFGSVIVGILLFGPPLWVRIVNLF